MTVTLKKCCRGPPLIPRFGKVLDHLVSEELDWEPQESSSCFNLSSYLKHVLGLCGMDSSIIFDSLDGRRLVSFQAAVKRAVWPRAWQALEPIFKRHRAAYRQH